MTEQCGNCYYWRSSVETHGQYRYHYWPCVAERDKNGWCGQWRAKEDQTCSNAELLDHLRRIQGLAEGSVEALTVALARKDQQLAAADKLCETVKLLERLEAEGDFREASDAWGQLLCDIAAYEKAKEQRDD